MHGFGPKALNVPPRACKIADAPRSGHKLKPQTPGLLGLSECGGLGQGRQRRVPVGLGELRVLEGAGQEGVVGAEIEVAVAAQAEQDHSLLACLARRVGFLEDRADRVGGLGRRDDPLGARESP